MAKHSVLRNKNNVAPWECVYLTRSDHLADTKPHPLTHHSIFPKSLFWITTHAQDDVIYCVKPASWIVGLGILTLFLSFSEIILYPGEPTMP